MLVIWLHVNVVCIVTWPCVTFIAYWLRCELPTYLLDVFDTSLESSSEWFGWQISWNKHTCIYIL